MIPKNPETPLKRGIRNYEACCAALGPAPAGFRYLNLGEKFNNDTDYCLSLGARWEKFKHQVVVEDTLYPCITPVPIKRDSKGRFASQKPAVEEVTVEPKPEDLSNVSPTSAPFTTLVGAIALIDGVIGGEVSGLWRTFVWSDTRQGHYHWQKIHDGDTKLSADDISYLKAVRAEYQRRIDAEKPAASPAPKPAEVPLVERVKTLTLAYEALGKEIEALQAEMKG